MTKTDRQAAKCRLMKLFDELLKLNDVDLLKKAQQVWPAIKEATREECIKVIVMQHVNIYL